MDTGLTTRPIAGQNPADLVRAAPAAVEHAVATDLAPARSVTAVAPAAGPHNEARSYSGNADDVSREVLIDPAVREVIFRVVDVSSGRVVRQVPDEALLRLRAYTRAAENTRGDNGRNPSPARTNRRI